MKFWILSTNQDNLDITLKYKVFGLSSKKRASFNKIQQEDNVAFYVSRKSKEKTSFQIQKFLCLASVKEKHESDQILWKQEEDTFPLRLVLGEIKKTDILAPPLICDFSVVKNPLYWMLPFRSGVTEISQTDWSLLLDAMKG